MLYLTDVVSGIQELVQALYDEMWSEFMQTRMPWKYVWSDDTSTTPNHDIGTLLRQCHVCNEDTDRCTNQNMFRRLQLLEEVLQVERDKRCRLLEALVGEATTPRKRRGMQGSRQQEDEESLAESLLARKILPSTRVTLQLAMPELDGLFGRSSPEWEGPAEADPLQLEVKPLVQPRKVEELAPEAKSYKAYRVSFKNQEAASATARRVVSVAFSPAIPHKLAVVSGTYGYVEDDILNLMNFTPT
ncbi:hypothetical protein AK812_SmicGene16500 [Symbiodinium microadriaticum]|uniref:Uncharacterized protein n=1 Tax=Symbiodinium microadriaticum TaxID=2951 RepID=A0A1Q9E054_SYMMI|nr:hypothetical protein AK812_SmicGene16500 [Symbiodinium microadriaticum]